MQYSAYVIVSYTVYIQFMDETMREMKLDASSVEVQAEIRTL